MAIRIDVKELLDVLRLTPAQQNVMLIGKHGIGKSEIIRRFYEHERRLNVVAFFLGQMSDPGDLIGLMHKDEQTGRSVFLPPYWWPVDGRPIVLFLDELNRARPEILQSVYELALNKTLAGKRLPDGSIVVSAVNAGDEYQLTDLDPALISRFNFYEFAPTVEDWLLWAAENDVDPRVTTFIQQNHPFLDGDEKAGDEDLLTANAGLVKTPDRRAWVKVSNFVKPLDRIDDGHIKIIAGIVGTSAALMFKKSLAQCAVGHARTGPAATGQMQEAVEGPVAPGPGPAQRADRSLAQRRPLPGGQGRQGPRQPAGLHEVLAGRPAAGGGGPPGLDAGEPEVREGHDVRRRVLGGRRAAERIRQGDQGRLTCRLGTAFATSWRSGSWWNHSCSPCGQRTSWRPTRASASIRVHQGRMEYNPAFIDALDRRELEQVLALEAMRILLKHPYARRPRECGAGLRRQQPDPARVPGNQPATAPSAGRLRLPGLRPAIL